MAVNYVALAIPAFFVFLGLEFTWALRKGRPDLFTYENSVANVSVGIAERLLNLLIAGSFYNFFSYLYEHCSLVHIDGHWYVWIILLLTTDFIWYWYHRLGHEVNLFWGAHVVHHQSEEFNYTVSARITTLQAIVRNFFWCLLPLIGFHPSQVITILVIHGAYSFFTHTRLVGKLGWLEYVLITPSHHAVHHASNEQYLNKNYGDIFVFWDKMFGTFVKEDEPPVFGLTHPIKSNSFLWQHFHYYLELIEACRRGKNLLAWPGILMGRPENLDPAIRIALERRFLRPKAACRRSFRFRAYLSLQLLITLLALFFFSLFYAYADSFTALCVVLWILITLVNCGAMLEQQRWVHYLEFSRLIITSVFFSYQVGSPEIFLGLLMMLMVVAGTTPVRQLYYRFVYNS